MAQGTVKWFDKNKGFGFIEPDGGGADVFAHYSQITGPGFKVLERGQRVEFEFGFGDLGKNRARANEVHIITNDEVHIITNER
ncbi:cold-shock protein [Rhodococcus sp. BH5]|uniref:cold-shock protein n=1 Tax=Rhodococcus sp. BH5 TaxID=2871702 RepID=UPI0022CD51BE|nr:cold-shock protein [Rhodococcus sp. BH5]MCZ9635196.1 cold-shock protein [Rhodococcus sp. BH5]